MAKRRRIQVEVRIRQSVREAYETSALEPPERLAFAMHLNTLRHRLLVFEGLLPEAVESPREANRFEVNYTTLHAE